MAGLGQRFGSYRVTVRSRIAGNAPGPLEADYEVRARTIVDATRQAAAEHPDYGEIVVENTRNPYERRTVRWRTPLPR